MIIGITFLSLFTIFSSLLIISSEVTQFSAWVILILSLILTFVVSKTQKLINLNNNETTPTHEVVGAPTEASESNNKKNITPYILHTTFYMLLCVAIFLFYSHYQSTGSSPLVWNILPFWFLPVLFAVLIISVISDLSATSNTKTQNHENTKEKELSSSTLIEDPETKNKQKKNSFGFFFSFLDSRRSLPRSSIRGGNDGGMIYLFFPIIFLILPVLFPIGTDYDPFVHRAAETTIIEHGSISPRTFLYSGEYGLVSVISTVTHIPVKTVNIWLLPLLCLIVLPPILKKTFTPPTSPPYEGVAERRASGGSPGQVEGGVVLIAFFLLPFSLLTTTVPQGLGIFFLLLLLLLTWKFSQQTTINSQQNKLLFTVYCLLLAIASFLSHPFTGIAAFVFLGWNALLKHQITNSKSQTNSNDQNQKRFEFGILNLKFIWNLEFGIWNFKRLFLVCTYFLTSTLVIPTALYLNNYLPSQFSISSISFNTASISALKTLFDFGWIRYTDPLSFVYFFGKNYEFFFFLIILFPVLSLVRKGRERRFSHPPLFEQVLNSEGRQGMSAVQNGSPKAKASLAEENPPFTTHSFIPYLFSFLSIFISSLLILFFLQPNVTSAEHIQLFTRVFSISLVFLWPLFLQGILLISQQTTNNKKQKNLFTVYCLLLAVLTVSNIYLQFPHSDRFEAHKGYLVSQDDITTVQKIESFAQKPYLVLANQTVGAAALDQFGFSQYISLRVTRYASPAQYFYSIPVSSRAQRYYLQMLKNPSQKLVDEIFQTYEIQEFYLILNDYWKNSRIISRNLSKIANQTVTVGENTTFQFSSSSLD